MRTVLVEVRVASSGAAPRCSGGSGNRKQNLTAIHHIVASSTERIGAFNTGFETVVLHRPTAAADGDVEEMKRPVM